MLIYVMAEALENLGSFRFNGLCTDRVILSGKTLSNKKLYLLYDSDSQHYNMSTNMKTAMAEVHICIKAS